MTISYLRVSTDRQGASGLGLEGLVRARPGCRDVLTGGSQWRRSRVVLPVMGGGPAPPPHASAAPQAVCPFH